MKIRIALLVTLVVCLVVGFIVIYQPNPIDKTLASVAEQISGSTNNMVLLAEFGVGEQEDVYYKLDKRMMTITFGRCRFVIKMKDLPANLPYLEKIGITIKQKKNGRIIVRYLDEEVREIAS